MAGPSAVLIAGLFGIGVMVAGSFILILWMVQQHTRRQPVSNVARRPAPEPMREGAPLIMSHRQRPAFQHRQRKGRIVAYRALQDAKLKLETENQRLKTQLLDISKGQEKGIDQFLERERQRKPLTRSTAVLLMGKDKTAGLALIAERDRLTAPLPPEIAKMEPVPQ